MREFVDGGLLEANLIGIAGERLEQRLHHIAQLVCAHVGELLLQ